MKSRAQKTLETFVALVLLAVVRAPALAAQAAMPWESPLQTLLDSLTGPTARIIAGIAFFIAGGALLFLGLEGGAKRFAGGILGLAVMLGAANLVAIFSF